MSEIKAIFSRPFEVMQFWVSETYKAHQKNSGSLVATLAVNEPEAGKWFFSLSNGPGTPFIGDCLPPFLPTRENIAILNSACEKASDLLEKHKTNTNLPMPKRSICEGITPHFGEVSRDMNDSKYRAGLEAVLRLDWGIELPSLQNWDWDDVVLSYRPGLPCAAAMVRAVQPILEAVVGPLERVSQAAIREDERTFDVIEYRHSSGVKFPQRFDITEYFGKRLPNTDFSFDPPPSSPPAANGTSRRLTNAIAGPADVVSNEWSNVIAERAPRPSRLNAWVLGVGLMLGAGSCVYVPYSAELLRNKTDNLFEPVGYSFIWAAPDRERTCERTYRNTHLECRVRMDTQKVIFTVLALTLVTAGLSVLGGLVSWSRGGTG